jgi:ParB family chromosome partitioning protein
MGLGRGLGTILSDVEEAYEKDFVGIGSLELEESGVRIEEIDVHDISPNPFQPRKFFDPKALEELSQSIVRHGLLQPIVVLAKEEGYLLVAGERRLRAHKIANLKTIKAIVDETKIDEIKLRELSLLENIQREDLNAIELANAYAELIEVHNITHDELSQIVNKSRSQITNTMRLLQLDSYVQERLIGGEITQGHAKVLGGLDEYEQREIVDATIAQKLSVREVESRVKRYKPHGAKLPSKERDRDKLLSPYKEELARLLPFKHEIKERGIEICFSNDKDIENFLTFLKKGKL